MSEDSSSTDGERTTSDDDPSTGTTPSTEQPDEGDVAESPSFDIPTRPERNYTATGGIEYVGETAFHLQPEPEMSASELEEVLTGLLDADRYVRGDWFDLPRPVYLVHDREVSTAFRVVVRSGRLELHVLPSTDSEGLRALYDRLRDATDADWSVQCWVEQD